MSDSLWPHELQHSRLPSPLSCPQSLLKLMSIESVIPSTISSSVIPFSSFPQSFLASGSFPMSQLFASGGQRIGASPSASVLPVNIQRQFPLGFTGLISLLSKGLSRVFNTTVWKHQHSVFFRVHLSYLYMTTGKIIPLTIQILVNEVISLLFNMLSMFVIVLFPRNKCLLKYVGIRIILF